MRMLALLFIFLSLPCFAFVVGAGDLKAPINLNQLKTLTFAVTDLAQDSPPPPEKFQPLTANSFRCLDCVVWLQLKLEGDSELAATQDLLLEIPSMVQSAQLFRAGEKWPIALTGRHFALKDRTINDPVLLLPIVLAPAQSATYVLRLSGSLPISTHILLHSEKGWTEMRSQRWAFLAFYVGALATILLLNVFLFFLSDHRLDRLYYVLFQLSLHLVFIPNFLGYTMVLWPNSPGLDLGLRYVTIGLGLPAMALFASQFLQLRQTAPRLNRWVLGSAVVIVMVALMGYLFPVTEMAVGVWLLVAQFCLLIWVGIYLALRRVTMSYLYLAGVGFFLLCAFGFVAQNNNWLSLPFFRYHQVLLAQIGAFVESIILAFAISKKILDEKVLRQKAESVHSGYVNEARNAAEAASRAKSDFIRNMSHELRTPLNSLVGYSDFLLSSESPEPERRQIIETIKRQSEHLTTLVGDILDFTSLEKGSFSTSASPFNLRDMIQEISDFFGPIVSKKNMSIQVHIPPSTPPTFTGDRFRVRQILMNVIGNACKFSDKGVVQIEVAVEPGRPRNTLVVRVKDQGPGISPDYQKLIFEPFYQIHSEVSRRHGGMGLGLSYARDMAKALGGSLTLAASEPGVGSEFEIRLPEAVSIYSPIGRRVGLGAPKGRDR